MIIIPNPKEGESQKDFISRCIPYVSNEHSDWEKDKVVAVCYSIWKESKKEKNMVENKTERVLLHLCASLTPSKINLTNGNLHITDLDRSTILVGDGVYNGIYFPSGELEKTYALFDRQPINLNHSDNVEDIVGYIKEPKFENKHLTVKPIIDEDTEKYNTAIGYIKSRIKADAIPEVSVGIWADKTFIEEDEKKDYPEEAVFKASNLEPDHLALVTRGACSPKDGCGIGLQKNTLSFIHYHTDDNITQGYVFREAKEVDDIDEDEIELIKKELLKEKIKQEKLKEEIND